MRCTLRVLISRSEIEERVQSLATAIEDAYKGEDDLLVVVILKGAFIFAADLVRKLKRPLALDFMAISSYGQDTRTSGVVRILKDLEQSVQDRHVLVVEDIIDTGLTLQYLLEQLRSRRPKSLRVAALLDKTSQRVVPVDGDFVGFQIPGAFVVGYGLDAGGRHRNLPDICVLEEGGSA